MSKDMVSAIKDDYSTEVLIGVANQNQLLQSWTEKHNRAAKEARESVAKVMQTKWYTGYSSGDVEDHLEYYSFSEYDHYKHFYQGIVVAAVIVVAGITNIIIVNVGKKSKEI